MLLPLQHVRTLAVTTLVLEEGEARLALLCHYPDFITTKIASSSCKAFAMRPLLLQLSLQSN